MSSPIDARRIARNTLMLYVRMLCIMLISLYTSRVVLATLGVVDYGIYNLVGGVVAIMAFFTSSLSNVAQRYLSIGLEHGCTRLTRLYFAQCHTLMLALSAVVLLLGETVGLYLVQHLDIPPARMAAALWVYQFSLLAVVAGILQVTFVGAIIARERMGVYAYVGLLEAAMRLAIVFALPHAPLDRLAFYGFLMFAVTALTFVLYGGYVVGHFAECSLRPVWHRGLVRRMVGFVSYNVFGCFAWAGGIEGTNLLLNVFFGPAVNAARAIAVQVNSVVTRFTDGAMTAVKPQMIKAYAAGDLSGTTDLIMRSSKFGFFLAAALAVPLMVEAPFILRLWLGHVPEHTLLFTRLVLIETLIGAFLPPLWIAVNATGRIKRNQVYGRLITLAVLPASYVALRLWPVPEVPFVVAIVANVGYWLYCLYDVHLQLRLPVGAYARRVALPAAAMLVLSGMAALLLTLPFGADGPVRCVVVLPCLAVAEVGAGYLLMDRRERQFAKSYFKKKF